MSAPASANTTGAARLEAGMKLVLGQFASAMKAVGASAPVKAGQKYTLAGDEMNPKHVDQFLQIMGVPETEPDRNALLQLARVTASHTPGEPEASAEALAGIAGPVSDTLSVCDRLKTLLADGLASMSNSKKKKLRNSAASTVKTLIPLLKGDRFAIKLLHTLAGLGFFGTAGWLVWSAQEQGWKVGSWGVLVIGAIRLLGNLIYNDHDVVKRTWNMVYVHVGLGSVGYALEIAERCGFNFEANPTTIASTFFLNILPVLVFYFEDLWNAGQQFMYNSVHKRSGQASAEDMDLIRPILNTLQDYITTSKGALDKNSPNKPGNRTTEVALKAEAGVQRLFDRLKLEVSAEDERTWKELFMFLLQQAAVKAPSILYSLFTGIFLFVAAIGDGKALSDVAVLILILGIEMSKGVADGNMTPDTLGYRAIKLTLGRFFSIFTYAVPKIWYRVKTDGQTDLFNKDPRLAAILAHVGAGLICVLGLWVIPTFELFVACSKRAARRSASMQPAAVQAEADMELESVTRAAVAYHVPKDLMGDLYDREEETDDDVDADDEDEDEEDDVPGPLIWEDDSEDTDEDVDEMEVEKWENVMKNLTLTAMEKMGDAVDGGKQKEDGPGHLTSMAALGGFGYSTEVTPEFMEALDQMFG